MSINYVLEDQQLSAVSRLFSSGLISELAQKGKSPLFARLAKESLVFKFTPLQGLVHNFFDDAFSLLVEKQYRNEYIYKAAITQNILLGEHSLNDAVMLNEFRTCNNKADSVILNGTSTVYEIKSERDSLVRLEKQISSYRKVFARVNVVTGENHLNSVLAIIPEDVGVMSLSSDLQISINRKAIDLPGRTESEAIFNSIQLLEAKKILKKNGIEIPELPNTMMYNELRKRFITLSPQDAHAGMVEVLKTTRSLWPLKRLVNSLPKSLHTVALTTSFRKQDHVKLIAAMNTPICEALEWN